MRFFFWLYQLVKDTKNEKKFLIIFFLKKCVSLSLFFFKVLKIEYKYSYDLLIRAKKNLPIFWSGAEAFTDIEKKNYYLIN